MVMIPTPPPCHCATCLGVYCRDAFALFLMGYEKIVERVMILNEPETIRSAAHSD